MEIYQEEENIDKLQEYAEIANELSQKNSKIFSLHDALESGDVTISEKLFKRVIKYP